LSFSSQALFSLTLKCFTCDLMAGHRASKRINLIWSTLLGIGFPVAILIPFIDTYLVKHVPVQTQVPFEFTNGLLFIASILFGFSSLIIVSKDWVDKKMWAVLIPPLVLIVLSGVTISNLALGYADSVQALVFCSASFNANVVSTAFILGYITRKPTGK
jgi:hypothetical protein